MHQVFASCGLEAFLEGHVHAFNVLGGVPTVKIRDDNLRSAVSRVLRFSRLRVENDRWIAFRSHYGIDAFYCQPGEEGAHEKDGVEGAIGRFRRNHLVPSHTCRRLPSSTRGRPVGPRRRRLPHRVTATYCRAALRHRGAAAGATAAGAVRDWAGVQPARGPLRAGHGPDEPLLGAVRFIGRAVRVLLHASHLVIYDGRNKIARHERLAARGVELLFQVLTEREDKNSVAIASNESFSGWTKTFTDLRLCAAIVDRLTFNGTIIETGTDSYRLARTRSHQAATTNG